MTSPPTEYFHVCENSVEDNEFDIDRFIDLLCDYYHDLDMSSSSRAILSSFVKYVIFTFTSLGLLLMGSMCFRFCMATMLLVWTLRFMCSMVMRMQQLWYLLTIGLTGMMILNESWWTM